jgi:hypothetical protein
MNLLAIKTPTMIAQTHSGGLSNAILVLSPVIMIYHLSNINHRKAAGYRAYKKEARDFFQTSTSIVLLPDESCCSCNIGNILIAPVFYFLNIW